MLDTSLFDRAAAFALQAHCNTERRSCGIPYVIHCMEACVIAATMTDDPEILSAALLHDTLEDTDTTYEELKSRFGARVADLVLLQTDSIDLLENADWVTRKTASMERLKNAPQDCKIAAMGDKLSNMRAIARDYRKIGDGLWSRFHVTDQSLHAWHYRTLADALKAMENTEAYHEFTDLVEEVFGLQEHPLSAL